MSRIFAMASLLGSFSLSPDAANGGGATKSDNPKRIDEKGIKWQVWDVKSEGKTVGQVEAPEFDETNPDIGMKQISEFNWSGAAKSLDGKDLGYPNFTNWKQAVVSILNTQHSTNLRNRLRQLTSGKATATQLDALAMAKISMAEFQAAVGDPAKFAALKEQKLREVKAELEAKKAAGKAAAEAAGTAAEEAADESDVTATVPA